jgi:MSHA type pilus biogenesis protein MshL
VTFRHLFAAATALALFGCATPVMPPSPGYLKAEPQSEPVSGSIPAPVQVPVVPPRPQPGPKAETYSVVVNNVRVHELLFALARDAKLNIDIHPGITGTVTLNAIDQTLPQLLNRISKQVDMRYELDGPNLLIMPDTPFLRVYKIDYVNMVRDTNGDISVSAEIAGGGTTGGGGTSGASSGSSGGAGANVSSLRIRNTSNNRFWPTLESNIKDILHETDKILPTSGGGAAAASPSPVPAGQAGAASAQTASPAPVPNVTFREAASVISNPESGVLFIRATSRQHEKIREFLDRVLSNARREVLIEATIVEVLLSNHYQQGIDWSYIGTHLKIGQFSSSPAAVTTPPNITALGGPIFAMAYTAGNFNSLVKLLETFGTTRIISSPRITALNNQTAVLKVVENVVYFLVNSQQSQQVNAGTLTTVTTTPQTVPVGLVMNLTPQIGDDGSVLLNVKPSVSSITKEVPDPNPTLTIPNNIPQIATREMESVLKLTTGQIGVMGGLIQDRVLNSDDTIPGVNRLPVLGNLFAQRNLLNEKTELVIFLRPIVVNDPSVDGDFKGYKVFLPTENFLGAPNPGRVTLPDTQVQ